MRRLRFHSQFLRGQMYPYRLLIDGNDPRNIDVAVMSRHPIIATRTHRQEEDNEGRPGLFSRDCLEVEFEVEGRPLTLFVNHFKSMMGGRLATRDRRVAQAERLREIVEERFGPTLDGNFAVVGDLNDYPQPGDGTTTGIGALLQHTKLVNIVDRLPSAERWTHWYKSGRRGERARQLDYILLGAGLDARAGSPVPQIYRKGLPFRAEEYTGPRLDDVGENEPKASDHCPLMVEIPLQALDGQDATPSARSRVPRKTSVASRKPGSKRRASAPTRSKAPQKSGRKR